MNRLGAAAATAAAIFAAALPFFLKPFGIYLISMWAVLTIAAIGLNLTLGYAGQVSLAQGAFVGIGAYTTALLMQAGWPFAGAFIAAGALSFAVGWLLGYPALRVQHHYLAFVTLAFTTLVFLVLRNEEWLTNGVYGINGIARPMLFGWSTTPALHFYFFSLGMLAVLSAATWWMLRSPWGRAFVALRENPIRAQSLGIDTRRYTLMAFAIGSKSRGPVGRALCATRAIRRAQLLCARNVIQFAVDGDRRRQRLFLRPLRRCTDRGAAAGMDAHHRRLLSHCLCRARHGDDGILPVRHPGSAGELVQIGAEAARRQRAAGVARQGSRPMNAILEVDSLRKTFGGIVAVDDVSFDVREGEILGIIGPNGSGKSTLFSCVLGQLLPNGGEVRVDGKRTTGMRPCDLNRLGVSRTFQLLQVFSQLSVRDNLILAGQEHQGSMYSRLVGRADAGLGEAAERMIEFFALSHLTGENAGSLSYGQQKLLDAAMAFMAGPRLVLLDEPAGGVNLTMLKHLRERLQAYHAERKATFVVIEHQMEFVMALCTRVLVLAQGRVIAEGTPQDIRRNPIVIEAYLGHWE